MKNSEVIASKLSEMLGEPRESIRLDRCYHNWRRHLFGHSVPSFAAIINHRVIYCDYTMAQVAKAIKSAKVMIIKESAFDESSEEIEFRNAPCAQT